MLAESLVVAALLASPTEVVVTTASDAVNGSVVSPEELATQPGPDGISLREALLATNNNPGEYRIRFAPGLRGKTIRVGGQFGLPPLEGGNADLSGDVDGNGRPDITIRPARSCSGDGLTVASGGNRLHALALRGFHNGVKFSPIGRTRETLAGTELSRLVIDACDHAIWLLGGVSQGCERRACATHNRWRDLRITGNTIDTRSTGIEFQLGDTIGDRLERVTISDNRVRVRMPRGEWHSVGIGLVAGSGFNGTRGNRISDLLVSGNTITGNPEAAIVVGAGDLGADGNMVERVRIVGNRVDIGPGDDPEFRERSAVMIRAGDASSAYQSPKLRPIRYGEGNVVRDVEVSGNRLGEGTGLNVFASCCGAARNRLEKLRFRNNTIVARVAGYYQHAGVYVVAGGSGDGSERGTTGNRIHDLSVTGNRITFLGAGAEPPAGVYLVGGEGRARGNALTCIRASGNRVVGRPAVAIVANTGGASGNTASRGGC